MADNVIKLKVDSAEYEAKLKRATSGLTHLEESLRKSGKTFADVDKAQLKYIQELGKMETVSKTAVGRVNELNNTYKELAIQYNNLSEAEKKAASGQAMAKSLEEIKKRAQEAKKELEDVNKELQGNTSVAAPQQASVNPFASYTSKFTKANLYAYGVEKGVEALTSMIQHTKQLIEESSVLAREAEGIQQAYERLNRPDLLDKLRQATHGTVSDLELMKQAVKFKDFNLDIDSMGSMLAFAQQKAKDTGESIDYMVNSITTGLGRKSLMILDNLGLSAADIKDRMEETGDMTIAVADIINDRMKDVGDYYQTTSDRIAASNAIIENSMLKLGNQVQSTMGMTTDEIYNAFEIGFIATLTDTVKGIGVVIGKVEDMGKAIGITDQSIKDMGLSMEEINKPFSENPPFVKTLKAIAEAAKFVASPLAVIADLQERIAGPTKEDPNEKRAQNTAHSIIGSINRSGDKTGEYSKWAARLNDHLERATRAGNEEAVKYIQRVQQLVEEAMDRTFERMGTGKKAGTSGLDKTAEAIKKINKEIEEVKKKAADAAIAGDDEGVKKYNQELSQLQARLKALGVDTSKTSKQVVYAKNSIGALTKELQNLQKAQQNATSNSAWKEYEKQITAVKNQIKELKGELNNIEGGSMVEMKGVGIADWYLKDAKKHKEIPTRESIIAYGTSQISSFKGYQGEDKKEVSLTKELGQITSGVSGIFSGIESLGVELPEGLKDVMSGIQGVISILTGISTIISAIEAINAADAIIPFANGGIVGMAANGMLVGNHMSGDNLRLPVIGGGMIGVNDGELILNRAQQGVIANVLQQEQRGGGNGMARVSGEQIWLILNAYTRRTGQGEIVTWK